MTSSRSFQQRSFEPVAISLYSKCCMWFTYSHSMLHYDTLSLCSNHCVQLVSYDESQNKGRLFSVWVFCLNWSITICTALLKTMAWLLPWRSHPITSSPLQVPLPCLYATAWWIVLYFVILIYLGVNEKTIIGASNFPSNRILCLCSYIYIQEIVK
jgi:hypothetical protein